MEACVIIIWAASGDGVTARVSLDDDMGETARQKMSMSFGHWGSYVSEKLTVDSDT